MAGNISLSEILHSRPAVKPTIYGYTLPTVADHDGYIKIGYTDREDTESRIKEQLHTAAIPFKVLFKESAMRSDGTCFTDKDIHRLMRRKGFRQLNEGEDKNEWFCCCEEDVHNAIEEMRSGVRFEGQRTWNFSMRKEQQTAVELAKDYYIRAKAEDSTRPPKFLWNAKMRFGKTFAAYQLAKAMNFKKILVLTFKPAVESAWQEDLLHHVDFKEWQFVSGEVTIKNNKFIMPACDVSVKAVFEEKTESSGDTAINDTSVSNTNSGSNSQEIGTVYGRTNDVSVDTTTHESTDPANQDSEVNQLRKTAKTRQNGRK